MRPEDGQQAGFSTLTHARIRAGQGDRSGARRIVRDVLKREPWNREARDYFDQLAGQDRLRPAETPEPVQQPPQTATAEELGARFREVLDSGPDVRIQRLNSWLGRISEHQGEDDAG